ncbi:UDP-glucose 4-epimerase GalE [Allochromatium vinosum]|uniref:UDP-glucose 4-epimerase n=1 Tax=Allochromatium vinosum (strain ATCC 17899 / DSM 180 / NBRC 103801 / NCIMB 10441 / D) TaxID=572477 RepID=D3RUN0_ALLVD|nr:UDP-glucose 4-epimerase GalE [Allochromatium vinosum]ADC62889.1 UDP-glucose 4-epimerase [Allochromatium vinosum DSM 180]
MIPVLVTGGAGYIGSHTCKALACAGYRPITLDNLVYGHEWAVRWGPLEIGDISDRACLDAVIERHRPEAVIHFAAYAYVGESVRDPGRYYRNNVAGTLTLLEAMRDHAIPHIVFSSTCATYGIPDRTPITEDHPQRPINPYGASKLMVERMLADFEQAHGLGWIALRYFNAAGADPEGEVGEDHDPETHLIPLALQAAAGRGPQLQVFGDDYPTPDGSCIRDYIHVADLAEAHVRSLAHLRAGEGSGAFNLGTGQGASVLEVIAAAERVTGRPVPRAIGPRRPGDPPVLYADADKARRLLGWEPRYRDLAETIEHAWKWHQSR